MLRRVAIALFAIGVLLLIGGSYTGLVLAPRDSMMGDAYRIIYTHVPGAWMSLLAFTLNAGCCVAYLMRSSLRADALAEASAETGVLMATICLITGSIWAKPTWGTYWTWDPRLTSMAIMWLSYLGYLTLRRFADDPEKRATWSSAVGILIAVGVPVVWYSVKWWNSLHQVQSSPETVSKPMVFALRLNAFAYLFVWLGMLLARYGVARHLQAQTLAPPPVARVREEAVAS
ncbi:MAG: cytochrome c biogenesis protein CcsA [Myxococcota bacterium]